VRSATAAIAVVLAVVGCKAPNPAHCLNTPCTGGLVCNEELGTCGPAIVPDGGADRHPSAPDSAAPRSDGTDTGIDVLPTCAAACAVGSRRCDGAARAVEECAVREGACPEWVSAVTCEGSMACVQDRGSAVCSCSAPLQACGRTCIALQSDSKNCGACGHDCLGGDCMAGRCQPLQVTSSAVSAANVVLGTESAYIVDIGSGSRLLKVSKKDGTISPIAGGGVAGVALEGNAIYWTTAPTVGASEGRVLRASLDGTGAIEIANGQASPGSIVVDESGVYWLNSGTTGTDGAVMWLAPGAPAPVPFADGQARPASIATDAQNVYWFTVGPSDGRDSAVYKRAKAGGGIVALAQGQPNATGSPMSLFVRGDRVFFTPRGLGNMDGRVRAVSTDGADTVEYARDQVRPQAIVADDQYVYWVDAGNGRDGVIQRASLSTKEVTQVVGGLARSLGLAIDDSAIYYTTAGDSGVPGGLYRLAKWTFEAARRLPGRVIPRHLRWHAPRGGRGT
jgi:hypothetical protein